METDDGSSVSPRLAIDEDRPSEPLLLPLTAQRVLDDTDESLGVLGKPFDHRAPFFVGLMGAFGVVVAMSSSGPSLKLPTS